MIVTEVETHTQSRYKIYIDGEFAFVLYKGELRIYGIEKGKCLAESDYNEITQKILPKRAKLRCMNLLKSKRYTRKQLADKLRQGFYSENVIEEALAYVESYGYVDDRQFAYDFIEYHMTQKSRIRIRMDLCKKGIPFELTDEIWNEINGDDSGDMERQQIIRYLKKKNYDVNTATLQEKSKIFSYLYRKGFQIETIRDLLSLDITSI